MATLNCILHPHHVSLMKKPFTFQSLFHSFEDRVDPYYAVEGGRSHKGLCAPRFNVCETETAYILDGELPGVEDKSQIAVEWLMNQVLIIQGIIKPADTETATDPFQAGLHSDLSPAPTHAEPPKSLPKAQIEAMTEKPVITYPRQLLSERSIGEFQRSFTFPTEIVADDMKASLANGLLRIVVPKKTGTASETKRINVQ